MTAPKISTPLLNIEAIRADFPILSRKVNGKPLVYFDNGATAQKPQLRVHILPKIIKVAVPAPQHSPIFGQLPLSQMVCNLWVSTKLRTCL